MKILLIEDEEDIRCIAGLGLERIGGMEVIQASSGAEGIQKAADEKPDAILLDVMMPLMDGPSTLAALQEDPVTARIPVIFLTAQTLSSEKRHLKSLGATGVLTKPFDPLTLASQVRALLQEA